MPRKPGAVKKLEEARQAILKAEQLIQSVMADELVEAGYSPTRLEAANEVYRVIGHATALKIVREHLWTEYLS